MYEGKCLNCKTNLEFARVSFTEKIGLDKLKECIKTEDFGSVDSFSKQKLAIICDCGRANIAEKDYNFILDNFEESDLIYIRRADYNK